MALHVTLQQPRRVQGTGAQQHAAGAQGSSVRQVYAANLCGILPVPHQIVHCHARQEREVGRLPRTRQKRGFRVGLEARYRGEAVEVTRLVFVRNDP